MGKTNNWLQRMPHNRVESFLAEAGKQLTRPQFNAVLLGKKNLGVVDLPKESSIAISNVNVSNEDLPVAVSYPDMLKIVGNRSGQIVITQEIINDLSGIKTNEIPPIMIRKWELKRYVNPSFPHVFLYWPGGLSMKDIYEKLIPVYQEKGWGKVLFDTDWYGEGKESFFTDQIPAGWMALSLAPIPGTGSKNFLQQTEVLKDFVCKQIYQRKKLSLEVGGAVAEFGKKKREEIRLLIAGDEWQEGAQMLADLKINRMFCPLSPAEKLLFSAVIRLQTGENIFENVWGWTTALSRRGALVGFGGSHADGTHVLGWIPLHSYDDLRRFSFRRF